jgi:uncharacterized membrane protein
MSAAGLSAATQAKGQGVQGQGVRGPGAREHALRRLPRLGHRLALALTLAAIAHLLTILLIPRYAMRDAATLFIGAGAEGKADIVPFDAQGRSPILDADPATAIAICGFDLNDGPVRISARTGQAPLSISIHLRGGGVVYSVTDKAAQRGVVEFVAVTRSQYEQRVAADDDSETQRELRVVLAASQGIVVARALARQPSDRETAERLAAGMACGAAD